MTMKNDETAEVITATLVRGLSYTQLFQNPENPRQPTSLTFLKNEPKVVTEAQRAILEQNAVDEVTIGTPGEGEELETEFRQKFQFTVGSEKPVTKARARRPQAAE